MVLQGQSIKFCTGITPQVSPVFLPNLRLAESANSVHDAWRCRLKVCRLRTLRGHEGQDLRSVSCGVVKDRGRQTILKLWQGILVPDGGRLLQKLPEGSQGLLNLCSSAQSAVIFQALLLVLEDPAHVAQQPSDLQEAGHTALLHVAVEAEVGEAQPAQELSKGLPAEGGWEVGYPLLYRLGFLELLVLLVVVVVWVWNCHAFGGAAIAATDAECGARWTLTD
mmetsp:Transcript_16025/g.28475  ORF Transcript_16025/g.28475 Transcript_16025/m.28475 type:complete len:223 (-) Transcript_16025:180-848(-)